MSYGGGAAAGAAAAAAARARRQRKEEEEMTQYAPGDLEGWEFKILRATTRKFRDQLSLRAVLDEEAEAGWELVEKFDDSRIRLKRRVQCRENDHKLHHDPYRTWVGMSQGVMAAWMVGVLGFLLVIGVAIATFLD